MHILISEHFKKQLRKLMKKYPHIKEDLLSVIEPFDSQNAISIGREIFKMRIPSTDMQKGKSGSFRSYIYLQRRRDLLIPLCIYSKSSTENISENELKYHFDETLSEIAAQI